MPKKTPANRRAATVRLSVALLVAVFAAVVVIKNWGTVQRGFAIARTADVGWLLSAFALMTLTFFIASGIYGVLALHKLRYRQTVLIEVATAFINRLLPSGIGGLGVHGIYLYKRGHTGAEATVVVTVNNLVGMSAHMLLLFAVVAFRPSVFSELLERHKVSIPWPVIILAGLVLLVISLIPGIHERVIGFYIRLVNSLRKLRWGQIAKALLLASLLTITYTAILLCSARSIGIELVPLQVFIVFSIGMLTSTATPTPGGLVGAEAGLFAGFVAYGVKAPEATAAVLLFRAITYWLPLLPGAIALMIARSKKLV